MKMNTCSHQTHKMQSEGVECSVVVGGLIVNAYGRRGIKKYSHYMLCRSLGGWLEIGIK